MMKFLIPFFMVNTCFAKISGDFYSEFKRKDMDCAIEARLAQKNINQITFKYWNELCEDHNGNEYESSLANIMVFQKVSNNKIKVFQGNDSIEVDAKIADFQEDQIHYDFEVETEDGHLEIEESFKLVGKELKYSSIYTLDSKIIINKSGSIFKK